MNNIRESIDKKWVRVLVFTFIICCCVLSLTFNLFVEYQVVLFILTSIFFLILLLNLIAAIKMSSLNHKLPSKSILLTTSIILFFASILFFYKHGIFYGRKVVDATFLDERSRMDLALYANGEYIISSGWMFGSEDFSGTYRISNDDIVFDEYPLVNSDFIAKSIVKHGNKIFFYRNNQGQFQDTSYYFFKVNNN